MDERQRRVDTFVRGLLSGAVVGAAIAGSAIWERRRRSAQERVDEAARSAMTGPGGTPAPDTAPPGSIGAGVAATTDEVARSRDGLAGGDEVSIEPGRRPESDEPEV